jgi:hypothetical protein
VLVISLLLARHLILLVIILLLLVASGLLFIIGQVHQLLFILLDHSVLLVDLLLQSPSDLEHVIIVLTDVLFDPFNVLLSVYKMELEQGNDYLQSV